MICTFGFAREELEEAHPNIASDVFSIGQAPSISSSRCFVTRPPGAEKPPIFRPAARIRWHGTIGANGFLPSAWPTARAAPGLPSAFASSP